MLDLVGSILIFFSILIESAIGVSLGLLDLVDSILIFFSVLIESAIGVPLFLSFGREGDPPLSLKILYFSNISSIANFVSVLIVIGISLFSYNASSSREIYKSLSLIIRFIDSLIF